MSEPNRFLVSFAQALAAMALYKDGHPARERTVDTAYQRLLDLRAADPAPLFTFLGDEVLYGQRPLRASSASSSPSRSSARTSRNSSRR